MREALILALPMRFLFSFLVMIFLLPALAHAQKMIGVVTELETSAPLADVFYQNIFTNESGNTDSSGRFDLTVAAGQLISFQKLGYKTARVRIPAGKLPPYFKIQIEPGAFQLEEIEVRDRHKHGDYHLDSLRDARAYQRELNYKKMTGMEMIQHPFTALSKHYQSIMRFQKEYNILEEQRYVDYTFNEKIITQLTGLEGEELQLYMRQFRPTYAMLRSLPEYYYFSYIKESAAEFKKRRTRQRGYESNQDRIRQ